MSKWLPKLGIKIKSAVPYYLGVFLLLGCNDAPLDQETKQNPQDKQRVGKLNEQAQKVESVATDEKKPQNEDSTPKPEKQQASDAKQESDEEQPPAPSEKAVQASTASNPSKKQDKQESVDLSKGRELFAKKCKGCHGEDGKGQTKIGIELKIPSMASTKLSVAKIAEIIRNGVPDTKMKAFRQKLSPEEITAIATYVKKEL